MVQVTLVRKSGVPYKNNNVHGIVSVRIHMVEVGEYMEAGGR